MEGRVKTILAGDVGGTKTILALYSQDSDPLHPSIRHQYQSQEHQSLEDILQIFLADNPVEIVQAIIDVAGPVVQGKSRITNLPWEIDSASLTDLLKAPVVLVNDMDAIAYAVSHAESIKNTAIQEGVPEKFGRRAIIAPGTGLGEGFLVYCKERYISFGCEGGHTDFAPRSELQMQLLEYMEKRYQHISYERVCSGIGIQNLYAFLRDSGNYPEPEWLRDELKKSPDSTPLIVQTAMAEKAPICTAALDLFIEILGSEAGNLALKILATGGVYLAGGIPRRILPWLQKPAFMHAFLNKGRFREILSRIPLHVVLEPDTALIGAAWMSFDRVRIV